MYQLTNTLPIPPADDHYHCGNPKYPFKEMRIGESFSVSANEHVRVRVAAHKAAKRSGMKFTTRKFEGAVHCWRIA